MFQFFFAVLAGSVTIAGPCILPLLPIILGTSTTHKHPSRPLFIILGFVLSFSAFATLLSLTGRLLGIHAEAYRIIAGVVIALFGGLMVFPRIQERLFAKLQPLLTRITPRSDLSGNGLLSGFLLGASLGLVWTPCAGPVLGSILTLVASKQHIAQSAALLFAYALGAGIPMLLIAYGGQTAMTRVRFITERAPLIQRVFGILIIAVAIALLTGADRTAQAWLVTHAPWLFLNLNFNI